jgi:hypothetical protein
MTNRQEAIKSSIFWDITPRILVKVLVLHAEVGGDMFF